jgi:hypothetical protein
MQKYLYRAVVATLMLVVSFNVSNATELSKKDVYKALMRAKKNVASVKKRDITSLDINNSEDFLKKVKEASNASYKKYGGKVFGKDMSKLFPKKDNNNTRNTIFYMYSETMPFATIEHLIPQIKKLKEIKPKLQFYIVFNGFPKNTFFKKLRKLYKVEDKNLFAVKVHPFIYKYYNLKMVPAYIFLRCGVDEQFKFKQCKNNSAYLARGDMSLIDLFEVLSDKNKKYSKIYNYMIEAK